MDVLASIWLTRMQEKVFLGFLVAFATIVILVIFCDLGSSVVSVGQWEGVMFGPSSPLSSRRSRRISPVPRKVSSPSSPSSPSLKRREANAPTVSTISNSKRAPTGPTGLTGPSSSPTSPTSPTSPPSPSPSPSHPSVSTDVPEGPDSPMIVSPVVKKGLEGSNLSTPTSRRDPKTAGILARWQVRCTAQYNELKSQIALNVFFWFYEEIRVSWARGPAKCAISLAVSECHSGAGQMAAFFEASPQHQQPSTQLVTRFRSIWSFECFNVFHMLWVLIVCSLFFGMLAWLKGSWLIGCLTPRHTPSQASATALNLVPCNRCFAKDRTTAMGAMSVLLF